MIGQTSLVARIEGVRIEAVGVAEVGDAHRAAREITYEKLKPKLGAMGYAGIGLLGVAGYLIWRRP